MTRPLTPDKGIKRILESALSAHQRGEWENAKHLYRQVLQFEPDNTTALTNLASLHARAEEFDTALGYYKRALVNPQTPAETWFNYGNLQQKLGMKLDAEQSFQNALLRNPNLFPVYYNLGNLLRDREAYEEATAHYLHAIALNPKFAMAHRNLGNLYRQTGKYDRAIEHHRIAISLEPKQAETYLNLANALWDADHKEDAIAQYRAAFKCSPNLDTTRQALRNALQQRADASQRQGDFETALDRYEEILALQPDSLEALNAKGVALNSLTRFVEAEQVWQTCVQSNSDHVAALCNLGTMYRLQKRHELALSYLRRAVAVDPLDPDSVASLASSLTELGFVSEARSLIDIAIPANPQHADLLSMKAYALTYQTQIDDAQRLLSDVRKLKPGNAIAISNSLFSSLYSDSLSSQELSELHRSLSSQVSPAISPPSIARRTSRRDKTVRIGYLSPDFRSHPVGFFIDPVLQHHNKERFHTTCYALPCAADEHTKKLQSYGHGWRTLAGLNNTQIVAMIQADAIDILVDLTGHTAGGRPELIRARLAPVQAVFIGYPFSTGIPEMDYLIADRHLVPAHCERLYSETVARLPHSFLCYQPQANTPPVAPLPALNNGFVTFGSYNNLPKVSQRCLDSWAHVLHSVPKSRFVMMASSLKDEGTRALVQQYFVDRGIAEERISLLPPVTPLSSFLAEYARMDIALDTFPYNGGTTSCDALFMGCPVVTLEGETFIGRMGVSLLCTLGHSEWIAQSQAQFVEIAVSLANDLTQLSAIRAQLREQMQCSGLCDAGVYTLELEQLYQSWADNSNLEHL